MTAVPLVDIDIDPKDLVISRLLRAPRAALWRAWTDPERLAAWWCPKPWTTEEIGRASCRERVLQVV